MTQNQTSPGAPGVFAALLASVGAIMFFAFLALVCGVLLWLVAGTGGLELLGAIVAVAALVALRRR